MAKRELTTRSALNRLLAGAARAGELDRLYWMVEIKVAAKLAGSKAPVIAAASYPLGWVPVIQVGVDPALSRHEAELLLECLKMGNRGRLIDFALSLTSAEIVQAGGYQVYEWGDACWDCVCALCGAVWRSTGLNEAVCEACQPPTDNRGLSDGGE